MMRGFLIASTHFAALAVLSTAQAKPIDYDCALFNECVPSGLSQAKGATKGFSMAGTAAKQDAPANARQTRAEMRTNQRQTQTSSASAATGVDLQLNFVTGSADLTPGAQAAATRMATAMLRPGRLSARFVIEGHTDAVGTRASNLDLSRRRAEAVVAYLKAKGVDSRRFEVQGYGFDRPISGTSALNGANRRVVAKAIK